MNSEFSSAEVMSLVESVAVTQRIPPPSNVSLFVAFLVGFDGGDIRHSSMQVSFAAVGGSGEAAAREKNPFTPKAFLQRYWDKKITNNLPKPSFLLSKASPLSAVDTATFAQLAATNTLSTRLHEFCSSAHLVCSIESARTSGKHNQYGNFAVYQDPKNFTNYGSDQLGGGNSFKNYSQNQFLTPSQNDFRRYSRGSTDRKDDFRSYASQSEHVEQDFHTYGTGAIGGAGEFKQYTDSVNELHLRFTSYSDATNARTQSFSSYSDESNSGDQTFTSYAKNGNGALNEFNSYQTHSNVIESNFTNYGETGNGGTDKFNNYGDNMNVPNNNFKNYGDGGNGPIESFINYRNGSNVGADGFTSYAKNSNGGIVDFMNYGNDGNMGADTFTKYGKGAVDPKVGFKGYNVLKDTHEFKEYAKEGISFAEYNNDSSTNSASMASKAEAGSASGRIVNKWVEPGKFFREAMLKEGTVMPMPDIRDKMPERSFLPRSILSKLPFSSSKISELKQIFKVENDSSMEKVLESSLGECERAPSRGETKRCVGSVEDMIDFAISVLGHDVTVRTTENVNGSKKSVMVGSVKRINGGRVTQSVSCHQSLFPYLLYYCHSVPKVRVYEADLLDPTSKAKINHGVAICHLDTSAWSSTHGAFLALGPGPGRIEVCHWIFQNDMTWAIADHEN
ncbi:polygalacturonase 1 beta-like protein 3 [Neltuma alba]|uniref:polygalacturonase 1 beta-like protein 3 n=1 Tax=Neltuma alba TaxID=207710 RepID=UPI0010A4FA8D|nr:polygalacturonase 1 beta-like protein 3 [Prosopis alba]